MVKQMKRSAAINAITENVKYIRVPISVQTENYRVVIGDT
jgi:hypothetical protein